MNEKYVILIGGVPGVGKSSISGHIAKEMKYDIVLSGDYMREFLRPILKGNNEYITTSVYDSWKFFGDMTSENILKGFMKQVEIMNAGTESVINRSINNGENIIFETLYFYPDFIHKYKKNILPLYLYIKEEGEHKKHLEARSLYTHPLSHGSRLSAHLYEYRKMMEISLDFCRSNNIRMFDTTDYLKTRDEIMEYVKGEIENEN
ncbi:MAG: AAA family ATPase [Thermoplasmataceae archaeon]